MKTMKNMKQSRFILFVLSFLVMSVGNVYAQNVTVTGTVLDSTGEPVIGCTVQSCYKAWHKCLDSPQHKHQGQ